eukprot:m.164518 g.164518  ORF g.164518 m.164518 type:complete len:180 (-) comp18112_c0_seq2:1392-1931(-)
MAGVPKSDFESGVKLLEQAITGSLIMWEPVKYALQEGIRGDDGPDIILWMPGVVMDFIKKPKNDVHDLVGYLQDIMEAEFNMDIDDESTLFVARQIIHFIDDTKEGGTPQLLGFLEKVKETSIYGELFGYAPRHGTKSADGLASQMNDVALESMDSAPDNTLDDGPDEDGWETVKPKRK